MELDHNHAKPTFEGVGYSRGLYNGLYINLTPLNLNKITLPISYIHTHACMPSIFVLLTLYPSQGKRLNNHTGKGALDVDVDVDVYVALALTLGLGFYSDLDLYIVITLTLVLDIDIYIYLDISLSTGIFSPDQPETIF